MTAKDFITSAEVTAEVLNRDLPLTPGAIGQSIYAGAAATMAAVGCNTNLGILLLSFPLAHAASSCETDLVSNTNALRESLATALATTDVTDTQYVFDAIAHMRPAGLGRTKQHDVKDPASADLLTVMNASASRDRIARQYSHNFCDIFDYGLNSLSSALECVESQSLNDNIEEVTATVYMDFLAEFPDSHIGRKHDATMAEAVRDEARKKRNLLNTLDHKNAKRELLLEFDRELKSRGVNPGTSADLTVAVVYTALLQNVN